MNQDEETRVSLQEQTYLQVTAALNSLQRVQSGQRTENKIHPPDPRYRVILVYHIFTLKNEPMIYYFELQTFYSTAHSLQAPCYMWTFLPNKLYYKSQFP